MNEPKEEARRMVERFMEVDSRQQGTLMFSGDAKQCALIHCDEIIEVLETLAKPEYVAFVAKDKFKLDATEYDTHLTGYELIEYLKEVRNEIELL